MTYDNAGNLTVDTYSVLATSRAYDAENRMTSETQTGGVAGTYSYNADGQRVRRKVGSVETWQIYGLDGELLAEYAATSAPASPQKEYGYRNGQLLITATAGVSNSGLVGHWKFDENTGTTAADSSGNGNTGTLVSSADWGSGHSGAAVSLNGVSGFVKIKDGKISTATSGTISGWVKINTLSNGTKIVGYGGSAAANVQAVFGLELRQHGSNYYFSVIEVPVDGAWAADSARGSTVVQTGVWYHLALTSDGSSWKLYVNGVAETMTNQLGNGNTGRWFGNTTAASPDKTAIGGCRFNGVDYPGINGLIDEVRIYDRVLTAGEIATLASGGNASEVQWLVTDQLGTPRMIFDKTGSLAGVKRHDYLPFGEEIFAGAGGRTTAQGYSAGDGVRQKFTSKERDNETGLDYFLARYYSSSQGRFTGVDPLMESAEPMMPQSWNRYSYVLNNPLAYTDPNGEIWVRSGGGDIVWFSQERWDEEISKLKDSKGNAVYTPLTASEMEFNTNFGRVRLNPNGPDADAAPGSDAYLGFSIVGDNKTDFSVAAAAGIAIGARGRNPFLMAGAATLVTIWILTAPVQQGLPIVDNNFYSQSKDNKKKADGLIARAAIELGKLMSDPPGPGGPGDHHKKEIKAMLDRARKIAERLTGRNKADRIKQIEEIEKAASQH